MNPPPPPPHPQHNNVIICKEKYVNHLAARGTLIELSTSGTE